MTGDAQALEARARAGDAAAQFALAVTLDRAGRRAEATTWLETAATAGHVEALALLAVGDLQGLERPRDTARALARLRRAVELGGNSARRLMAVLVAIGVGEAPDWRKAVALVIDAGKAGDWQALRELGLLVEMAAPGSALTEDLLLRAGLQGDGLAAFSLLRRLALKNRVLASERVYAQWREGVTRIGHPLVQRVASAVAPADATTVRPGADVDWQQIERLLAEPPAVKVAAPSPRSEKPLIRRFDGLLTIEECEYVIGLSMRYLIPAEVLDRTSGQPRQSRVRTNSVAVFWPVHQDLVIHAINLRLASAAGLPVENGEMLNVLMYRPGEEYRAHFDFFPIEAAKADPSGQRIRTLLVYLNDDYDGGETQFLSAGISIKGGVGDGVLFHNCDASGAPDRASLHSGVPVKQGEKWLLSKWWREKRFVHEGVNSA